MIPNTIPCVYDQPVLDTGHLTFPVSVMNDSNFLEYATEDNGG